MKYIVPGFFGALLFLAHLATSASAYAQANSAVDDAPAHGNTLETLLERAIANSPQLQSFEAARTATLGERQQAGLWQNPELGLEAENVAGNGPYKSFNSAEATYSVSQLIEIGGKRSARVGVATHAVDLAERDIQSARLDLIRDVTEAFNIAVAAGEEVKLAEEQAGLADDMLKTVITRVNAAREPLIQKSKASVALATSRVALEKARRDQLTAQNLLANLTGSSEPIGSLDASGFYSAVEPTSVADIKEALSRNPDLARWKSAIAKSAASLDLEEANAIPDPRISAGFRDFRETNNNAFVIGLSIPIPLLNQNQGNIAKARADVTKTARDQRASELVLSSALTKSLQAQQGAYAQAVTLQDNILPDAKQAYALSKQGYQSGKSAYLDVLDAQRTLTEARFQYVEALKEYHNQRAAVERLTAKHLDNSQATGATND